MSEATPVSLSGLEGRVWKPSPLRAVSIVGMGSSSQDFIQACYHQQPRGEDHQVWTVNSGPLCFASDVVWNMHHLKKLREVEGEVDYFPLYEKLKQPLVTISAFEELPTSQEFPLGLALEAFKCNYFSGTIAYMIAGALLCGVKELHVYGADYNYEGSQAYEKGRAGVEFWLGIAFARGVLIDIAPSSTLLDLRHRVPGGKGAQGYGEVYGYFNRQPELDLEGKLIGFTPEPVEMPDVVDAS